MTELLLSSDVAKASGGDITPSGVRQAADRGRLRTALRTPGGVRLFTRQAAEEFLASRDRVRQKPNPNGEVISETA